MWEQLFTLSYSTRTTVIWCWARLLAIDTLLVPTTNTFGRTRESVQCNFFIFWSRDVHPVQNLLLCTKFHENPIIFPWDMAIYQFSKWRPSAILELFYHHTRPPTKFLLLAAAACQISYQSDTQLWRYSYLNFSNIWLKMPIQAPKMGVLGDFGPLNVIIHHRDPQKAHSCVNPRISYQL